ncbi:MAG: GntR family transcriptional regulator [Longicatena sp.]
MQINQKSEIALYQQIANEFKKQILSGELKSGDYLPSVRGLAADLKLSVVTTLKAYEQLSKEGLISSQAGKGYYVNEQNDEMVREQHMRIVEDQLQKAIDAAKIAKLSEDEVIQILHTLMEV